jgi:hypothetical protein
MAYDNGTYGRHDADVTEPAGFASQPRFLGQAGFREEADFRGTPPFQATAYQPAAGGYPGGGEPVQPPTVPASELEDVFDSPADRDRGRDRMLVHWLWEVLLLIGVGALGYLLWQADSGALRGDGLSRLLIFATGFGLLALAAGVTLRAAVPNLAIGPVAAAAGAYFAQRGDEGVATPTIFALGVAVLLGLAVAALITIFHVPGWAASLAAAAAAVVWLQLQDPQIPLAGSFDPTGQAAFLFAVVAAVGILGGLLGTGASVRRAVGRFRPAGDPARRRGGQPALLAAGATVLSMVFAVVAGVLLVAGEGVPAQGSVGVHWLEWTLIGFGVALAGGTSVFGRRGGVFGTILAVVGLVLFDRYQLAEGWEISLLATAACAVAGGLAVSRLVETFGRPRAGEEDDHEPDAGTDSGAGQWETATPAGASDGLATSAAASAPHAGSGSADGWPSAAADSWSSALPARPAPSGPDPWDDDRWTRR